MLFTSRTPLRVSFFGGGTDYPEYFQNFPGSVVGMAINKYIYISVLQLRSFLDYRFRIAYSRNEMVNDVDDIQHPVVRAILKEYSMIDPLDISIMADLPARSGLGSSSAFTVGLINLIEHMHNGSLTKLDLARRAVYFEREVLQEQVGLQDQFHASFGGINRFDFIRDRISITPLQFSGSCLTMLTDSLMLVFTGIVRHASKTLDEQITKTKERTIDRELNHLRALVDTAIQLLEGGNPDHMLTEFGALVSEGWMTKRSLSSRISTPVIDELFETALRHGALGGKLCGAGAGGFFLLVVPPERVNDVTEAIKPLPVVKIGLDTYGSTILNMPNQSSMGIKSRSMA